MELIDRDDFRQRMFRAFAMCSDVPANNVYQILMNWLDCALQESPTIDAVPVVRCKDCSNRDTDTCPAYQSIFCDMYDDDYCSFGKRKDLSLKKTIDKNNR